MAEVPFEGLEGATETLYSDASDGTASLTREKAFTQPQQRRLGNSSRRSIPVSESADQQSGRAAEAASTRPPPRRLGNSTRRSTSLSQPPPHSKTCFPYGSGAADIEATLRHFSEVENETAASSGKHKDPGHPFSNLVAPEFCLLDKPITTMEETTHLGSCAVVFPTRDMIGSGAGKVIDLHQTVFRVNAHNAAQHGQNAHDFGTRTTVRTLTSAMIIGGSPKHDIELTASEIWVLFSGCSHAQPEPWCVKLRSLLGHWRRSGENLITALDFVPQVAHRASKCLSDLKRAWRGPGNRFLHHSTTGFITVLYAMQQCSCVTVFGLCDRLDCKHALAWSGHSDRFGWRDPAHDFTLEHLALLLMARSAPETLKLGVTVKSVPGQHSLFQALQKTFLSRFQPPAADAESGSSAAHTHATYPWSSKPSAQASRRTDTKAKP
ncbi:hypothetical protein CYMTET_45186 [Cymbomonas tetramitiformis]|uniref:Uncharacterized protein n=1 Tax=Cymbomonas tetramitiformis TaxID=36881 RepID=A0AAE0BZY8_9CHLO|nr:hypothetical protein CYMTET_45186 [Cymbomonas tetramitiformis]